jgi:hypothetical protein
LLLLAVYECCSIHPIEGGNTVSSGSQLRIQHWLILQPSGSNIEQIERNFYSGDKAGRHPALGSERKTINALE